MTNDGHVEFKINFEEYPESNYCLKGNKENFNIELIDVNSSEYLSKASIYAPLDVYVSKYADEYNYLFNDDTGMPDEAPDYVVNKMFENYYLHMKDYVENYGLCSGDNGLYEKAKIAFLEELTESQRYDFRPGGSNENGYYRLQAWAIANGETFNPDADNPSEFFSSKPTIFSIFRNDASTEVWIIAIISLLGLTAIGALIFYKKRKEY